MGLVLGKHKGEPTNDDFARLFVALIDAYPSGVDVNTFCDLNGDRIDPQALITVSIHSHVVVYNCANATYHFHDVAFRDVAKEILIEDPTYKSRANVRLRDMIFSNRKVEEGEQSNEDFKRLFVALIAKYPVGVTAPSFCEVNGVAYDSLKVMAVNGRYPVLTYNRKEGSYHFHDRIYYEEAKDLLMGVSLELHKCRVAK